MTYSILPHTGNWRNGVPSEAYDVNDPIIIRSVTNANGNAEAYQLVASNQSNVIIETVKQAEDGNGVIVRLYEGERSRGKVTIQAGFNIKEAYICNLLEENQEALLVDGNAVTLSVRPYMIASLRLIPE
jgi:alpha-mannosidase